MLSVKNQAIGIANSTCDDYIHPFFLFLDALTVESITVVVVQAHHVDTYHDE